jgi:hypothetical protein
MARYARRMAGMSGKPLPAVSRCDHDQMCGRTSRKVSEIRLLRQLSMYCR